MLSIPCRFIISMYESSLHYLPSWVGTYRQPGTSKEEDMLDLKVVLLEELEKKNWWENNNNVTQMYKINMSFPVPSVLSVVRRVIREDALCGELLLYIHHGCNAITHSELLDGEVGGWGSPVEENSAAAQREKRCQINKCGRIGADSWINTRLIRWFIEYMIGQWQNHLMEIHNICYSVTINQHKDLNLFCSFAHKLETG